jgi:SAM-dependent methyltransferase
MEPGKQPVSGQLKGAGQGNPGGGYDPWFFEKIAEAEPRHFWFRARNAVISAVAASLLPTRGAGSRILEIGCGTGGVLARLQADFPQAELVGMDLYLEALEIARSRTSCRLVRGDIRQPPFGPEFDLVGMFDVVEHLNDDLQALRDCRRLVKPGGHVLITVPAHPELWSYFDVASCHCRRYVRDELVAKLVEAGFEVEFASEFMQPLYALAWVKRRWFAPRTSGVSADQARSLAARELKVTPLLNGLLLRLLAPEAVRLGRREQLGRGTSIIAIGRAPLRNC